MPISYKKLAVRESNPRSCRDKAMSVPLDHGTELNRGASAYRISRLHLGTTRTVVSSLEVAPRNFAGLSRLSPIHINWVYGLLTSLVAQRAVHSRILGRRTVCEVKVQLLGGPDGHRTRCLRDANPALFQTELQAHKLYQLLISVTSKPSPHAHFTVTPLPIPHGVKT